MKENFDIMCIIAKPINIPYSDSTTHLHNIETKIDIMLISVFIILTGFLNRLSIFEKRLGVCNVSAHW